MQNTSHFCVLCSRPVLFRNISLWWKYADLKAAPWGYSSRRPRWRCDILQMDPTVQETGSFSSLLLAWISLTCWMKNKLAMHLGGTDVRNNLLLVFSVSYESLRTISTAFLSFENLIGCTNKYGFCWIRLRIPFLVQRQSYHYIEELHRNWGIITYKYMETF